MGRTIVILLAASLLGCAGLYSAHDDTTGERAAKVTTRVLLGIPTLGISEIIMFANLEHRQRLAYYRDLSQRLAASREAVESASTRYELDRAVAAYNATAQEANAYYARQAAAHAQRAASRQRHLELQVRSHEAQADRNAAMTQELLRGARSSRPLTAHCTSRIVGNMVYTDCY